MRQCKRRADELDSINKVSTLRLANTRSNTFTVYSAGTSSIRFSSRLAPAANSTKGLSCDVKSQLMVELPTWGSSVGDDCDAPSVWRPAGGCMIDSGRSTGVRGHFASSARTAWLADQRVICEWRLGPHFGLRRLNGRACAAAHARAEQRDEDGADANAGTGRPEVPAHRA